MKIYVLYISTQKVPYERGKKNHYTVIGKNKLDFKQKKIISENVKKTNFFRGV